MSRKHTHLLPTYIFIAWLALITGFVASNLTRSDKDLGEKALANTSTLTESAADLEEKYEQVYKKATADIDNLTRSGTDMEKKYEQMYKKAMLDAFTYLRAQGFDVQRPVLLFSRVHPEIDATTPDPWYVVPLGDLLVIQVFDKVDDWDMEAGRAIYMVTAHMLWRLWNLEAIPETAGSEYNAKRLRFYIGGLLIFYYSFAAEGRVVEHYPPYLVSDVGLMRAYEIANLVKLFPKVALRMVTDEQLCGQFLQGHRKQTLQLEEEKPAKP